MINRSAAVIAAAFAIISVKDDPVKPGPSPGPEWIFDKESFTYRKEVPVQVSRHAGGKSVAQNFSLKLSNGQLVSVLEHLDNKQVEVIVTTNETTDNPSRVWLTCLKDEKQNITRTMLSNTSKCSYIDYNGDGEWDFLYDSRTKSKGSYIWFEEKWQPVWDSRNRWDQEEVVERKSRVVRDITYRWTGEKWEIKK